MKKIAVILMLFLPIMILASSLDNYLFNFDYLNYDSYTINEIEAINTLMYSLNEGRSSLKNTVILENYDLNEEELKVFNLLLYSLAFEIINPYERLKEYKELYPESLFVKAMFIEYAYKNWSVSGRPDLVNTIFLTIEEIENSVGENPFTKLIKADIFSKSRAFSNIEQAEYYLEILVNDYPPNQRVYNSYIEHYINQNDFEKITILYDEYISFSRPDLTKLFAFLTIFHEENNKTKAISLADKLIEKTTANYILAKSYEILGDYEEDVDSKIEYYIQAYRQVPPDQRNYAHSNIYPYHKFASIHYKLARTAYENNPRGGQDLVRVVLNKGNAIDPNNKELEELLMVYRGIVRNRALLRYFLPISIFVVLAIIFIIKWEKNKRKINRGVIKK